ncbi:hypothetical protein OPQ81_002280 [Rhizoctonia solani]|nr:hypothetical protein OPQ81_002280 [Rhizoctonia solani]
MKLYNSTSWPKELALDVIWQYKAEGNGKPKLVAQVIVIYDGTLAECLKTIEPLTCFASSINIDSMKWWDVVVIEQGHGAITEGVVSAVTGLMCESRELLDKYDPWPRGKSHLLWVHIGEETAKIVPKDTAFPWRNGTYVCYFKMQWTRGDITSKMIDFVGKVKKALVPHTIEGKAAYVNFVDRTIQNWQEAYYGGNYPRLQQVKKDWDPDNFFKFEQSVELPGVKSSQTPTGGDRGNNAEGTGITWNRYSLPQPDKIWNMEEPSRQKVARAIRDQVALGLTPSTSSTRPIPHSRAHVICSRGQTLIRSQRRIKQVPVRIGTKTCSRYTTRACYARPPVFLCFTRYCSTPVDHALTLPPSVPGILWHT